MDEETVVAVQAASEAVAAAIVAQNEVAAAEAVVAEAVAVSEAVNEETVVTAAETAVALAEGTAALATVEAAQVIQQAEVAIAQNEESEKWQDERIKGLETLLQQVISNQENLRMAMLELVKSPVSPQSTPALETKTDEAPPMVTESEVVVAKSETQTEALPKGAVESPGAKGKRERVLRFL